MSATLLLSLASNAAAYLPAWMFLLFGAVRRDAQKLQLKFC
ncbi:hypothetical protein O9929_10295 [Vibrio lentus]|nr:hypothetical protein [Vibrio lentus]